MERGPLMIFGELSITDDAVMNTLVYDENTGARSKKRMSNFKLQEDIPVDIVHAVMDFLHFRDVLNISMTSKYWLPHCNKRVEACSRYPYKPEDSGAGTGLPLDLGREDWKSAVLSRELHALQFGVYSVQCS